MFKIYYKLVIFCFTVILLSGCMRKPNDPSGQVWIDLKLNYKEADNTDLQNNGNALLKTDKLIEDRVLLLNFDEGRTDSALDKSSYQNHASLHNVQVAFAANYKAIDISDLNSYALVANNPVLNGTHGLKLSATVYLYRETITGDRMILDKHDFYGGYTLGINRNYQVFFRVWNDSLEKLIVSDSVLTPEKWYTISAQFSSRPPTISVYNKVDRDTTGTSAFLPQTSSPLVIGAENNLAGLYTKPLHGLVDLISITSTINFEDFDFVRVAIIDLNSFIQNDSIRNMSLDSLSLYFSRDDSISVRYLREMHKILYAESQRASLPTWASLRRLWDIYFTVVTERNLQIDGGFAQGTINGIPGLNLITVAAIRNDILVYYGQELAWGRKDQITSVAIEMNPLENK